MAHPDLPAWTHDVVAGRLCLELVNTLGGLRGATAPEHLAAYPDLLAWAVAAGALDDRRARRLVAEARRRPADAEAALAEARALREAIHDAVWARLEGKAPDPRDVERIDRALARALARRRLVAADGGFGFTFEDDPAALDAPLWPVALSAAELLTRPEDLERVRRCSAADTGTCGWLFVDETRSHTRRWCTMKDCGNRAKARRHYHRTRAGEPAR